MKVDNVQCDAAGRGVSRSEGLVSYIMQLSVSMVISWCPLLAWPCSNIDSSVPYVPVLIAYTCSNHNDEYMYSTCVYV